MSDTLRIPPHSLPAEQWVIGALLLDANAYERVGDVLRADDFYRVEHREIFAAISRLAIASKPFDLVSVFEATRSSESAEAVTLEYLNGLMGAVISAGNIRRHAEIVREKSLRRQLIAAAMDAASQAWDDEKSIPEVLGKVSADFSRLERFGERRAPITLASAVAKRLDAISGMAEGQTPPGWSLGIQDLDRLLTGGAKPGKVYCIAARPSVGKSTLARHAALTLAKNGHTTLLCSMEMPTEEIADTVLSEEGRIDNERLQTGRLEADDWANLAGAADLAANLPLYLDDEGSLTPQQIRAKARSIKGLQVLVVDYLQLAQSTLKKANRNDQVQEISQAMKALALEMKIPVIVLSQLNRAVELRADKEPVLADLRDSGAIEQDCDIVIFLWTVRDDTALNGTRLVGCKVAKQRGGRLGRFALRFRPSIYAWYPSNESLDVQQPREQGKGFE